MTSTCIAANEEEGGGKEMTGGWMNKRRGKGKMREENQETRV
jgi:hypothetical protein